MSMPVDQGGGGIGGRLQQQLGPLKMWQWGGVILVGVFGYVWWARRKSAASGSDPSAVDNSGNGYATGDMNSGDYASGYDYGYAAGLNANGDGSGSASGGGGTDTGGNAKGPIAHNRFTAKTKDPAGKMETVTGYGTWIKSGTGWKWQPGIPKQFALPGNGTTSTAAVPAAVTGLQPAADISAAGSPDSAAASAAQTLDQATGANTAATTGSASGAAGSSAPRQTATSAQRIAQIIKDLQNPGPNFSQADQQQYLTSYQSLTGHAYTGKLGQLQVGQHVAYATV